jgi:glucose-6-phosphate 1-dehydrogenase
MSLRDLTINPLRIGMRSAKRIEPCIMVIFGATGDLTSRKLLPALYNLALEHPLPPQFTVVGMARRPLSHDDFRKMAFDAITTNSRTQPISPSVWDTFSKGIFYNQGEFHDRAAFERLGQLLDQIDRDRGTMGNRIFYLATQPEFYSDIAAMLSESGAARPPETEAEGKGWSRIVIEKPFGHDLATAQQLNADLSRAFHEDQIYRMDHYLGKETVQNIMVFRFGNGIFEPIWNRRYIEHVQITVAESLGLEGRAEYYESAGAIRDILQNHMMQLLTLTAMEPPVNFGAAAVRDEKLKVLGALPPVLREIANDSVRAQYSSGYVGGIKVPAYREEEGVKPDSMTETYVAVKLNIENWRWAGVPFYLRTGKRLAKRVTEIAIKFRRPPYLLFQGTGAGELATDVLSMRIQPDEGITLRFNAKVPGGEMHLRAVNMDFFYGNTFGGTPPEAYERLLLDAMAGDATLFTRIDETLAAWRLVDTIVQAWRDSRSPVALYAPGTWGPEAADQLIERDGHTWRRL